MFREKYKNAVRHIDSTAAQERVLKRLEEPHRRTGNLRQITAIAACFAIVITGIYAYDTIKKDNNTPANDVKLARMTGNADNEIAIDEPLFEITETTSEEFEKILQDGTYQKRTVEGATILEKNENNLYECWIQKDGKITKITAGGITDEEKDNIIHSVLQ